MITAQDIADTYIIHLIYDKLDDKALVNFRLEEIKQTYLDAFRTLFIKQFDKYKEKERIYGLTGSDISFVENNLSTVPFSKFPYIFMLTVRGDRFRGNERWVKVAENVVRLEQAKEKGIIQALDALNNAVHNSKDTVLNKFDNFVELLLALNHKKVANHKGLLKKTSSEINYLAQRVL